MNPLCADKGEGCADSIIKLFNGSINFFFDLAWDPQRINTNPFLFSLRICISLSVRNSQPKFLCYRGLPFSTVSNEFNSNTP